MKNFLINVINFDKSIINEYILDYKYPWELLDDLNNFIVRLGKTLDKNEFYELDKNIWINKNAVVDSTARIIGPCIIDNGAIIKVNAYIRENVIVGKKCVLGNSSEVKNSILFDEVKIPHFNYVGDSILGYKSHLGAGAIISNVKSDKSTIYTKINGVNYNTNRKKYGALIGDNVEVGSNAVLVPGVFINSNSTIYPLTMVRGEIGRNKIVKDINRIIDKKKVKLYIDFDSTLFDTDKFYLDFLEICKQNNIPKESVELYKNEMFNNTSLFNLDKLVEFFKEKKLVDYKFQEKINSLYFTNYVYEDVIPVLEKLDDNYESILLTYGDYDYQMHKIDSSGLKKYFKEIIITNKNKAELEEVDYLGGIFIDNSPKEVERLFERNPKRIIRIRRKSDEKSQIETDIEIPEYVDFLEIYEKELI